MNSNPSEIQGWFDYSNIYERAVTDAKPGDTLIELGVWKGRSLCYLATLAKQANKNLRVIGIDRWQHTEWDGYQSIINIDREKGEMRSPLEQCRDNLKAHGVDGFAELIISDSIEAAKLFKDESVRFIFVDDTHNSEHVERELNAWLPKIIPGVWIAGHDYPGSIEAGVKAVFPHAVQDGSSWVAYV